MRRLARLAAAGGCAVALTVATVPIPRASAQGDVSAQGDASAPGIQDQNLPPPPGTASGPPAATGTAGGVGADTGPAAPPAPEAASQAAPSVPAPTQWVQGRQAQLTILDKIYGTAHSLTATVGERFSVRFLTVTVLACWVRPPSLPPDAAAFLQVTDTHAASGSKPEFQGWIFKAEPALSGMNDPATDISLGGCG